MIAYQSMNDDPPTVSKHGSTFNEVKDLQQQYPFQLCPECISENTDVVKQLKSDQRLGTHTGSKYRSRRGIFYHQCERVNYICKDCGCEFYQLYRIGKKQSVEVDEHIALTIIGFILTALSLFMYITSMSIDDPTGWMGVVALLSFISFAIFGCITVFAFTET